MTKLSRACQESSSGLTFFGFFSVFCGPRRDKMAVVASKAGGILAGGWPLWGTGRLCPCGHRRSRRCKAAQTGSSKDDRRSQGPPWRCNNLFVCPSSCPSRHPDCALFAWSRPSRPEPRPGPWQTATTRRAVAKWTPSRKRSRAWTLRCPRTGCKRIRTPGRPWGHSKTPEPCARPSTGQRSNQRGYWRRSSVVAAA